MPGQLGSGFAVAGGGVVQRVLDDDEDGPALGAVGLLPPAAARDREARRRKRSPRRVSLFAASQAIRTAIRFVQVSTCPFFPLPLRVRTAAWSGSAGPGHQRLRPPCPGRCRVRDLGSDSVRVLVAANFW